MKEQILGFCSIARDKKKKKQPSFATKMGFSFQICLLPVPEGNKVTLIVTITLVHQSYQCWKWNARAPFQPVTIAQGCCIVSMTHKAYTVESMLSLSKENKSYWKPCEQMHYMQRKTFYFRHSWEIRLKPLLKMWDSLVFLSSNIWRSGLSWTDLVFGFWHGQSCGLKDLFTHHLLSIMSFQTKVNCFV